MGTPRTRYELWQELTNEYGLVAEDLLDSIEELGLAIVPVEPTDEILTAMHGADIYARPATSLYRASIAASPFSPQAKGE
jgi:hypothetical protein